MENAPLALKGTIFQCTCICSHQTTNSTFERILISNFNTIVTHILLPMYKRYLVSSSDEGWHAGAVVSSPNNVKIPGSIPGLMMGPFCVFVCSVWNL